MDDNQFVMTLRNKKVFEFYKNNPSLDFEQISVLCVELFENILQDVNSSMNKAIGNQILKECKDNRDLVNSLSNQLTSVTNSISKLNNDLILRSLDIKKDYIEEVKGIITNISNEKNDKITSFIEKLNDHLLDKTTILLNDYNSSSLSKITSLVENSTNNLLDRTKLILNEVIPENQLKSNKFIQDDINKFYNSISEDTRKLINLNYENDKNINSILLKYQDRNIQVEEKQNLILGEVNKLLNTNKDEQINSFINSFEVKFNCLVQSMQSPIVSVINSSEERLNSSISLLNENTNKQQNVQTKIFSDLEEYLNKYRNSSLKGGLSENHLSSVLTKMFPTAEIIDTSKLTSSCDFKLVRELKDNIYIENKDYSSNVDLKEVKKFINDCELRQSHGIFLSQNTGITSKRNYQIDIQNGYILVYVHNCEYMASKIQIAVDIIDTLSTRIKELNIKNIENKDTNLTFPKEVIDEINDEYQKLISKKETIINLIKEFHKTIVIHLDEIKLPKLENILPSKFSSSNDKILRCDMCNNFTCETTKSLSAHKRWCKKPSVENSNLVIETVELNIQTK